MTTAYLTQQQLSQQARQAADEFRSLGKTLNKMILVNDSEIIIYAYRFGTALTKDQREMLLDVICQNHQGRTIEVVSGDGENLKQLGLLDLLQQVVQGLDIPPHQVRLATTNPHYHGPFAHQIIAPGAFVAAVDYIVPVATPVLDRARFVGTAIGRFSLCRLRLAYEIDQAFPGDAKIVFQDIDQILHQLAATSAVYDRELTWAKTRQFDRDVDPEQYAKEHWTAGCQSYSAWSAQFEIDVVAESDVFNYHWLTEKVAKPLATGKPFVLLGGVNSLQLLRQWGFKTFDTVIDESYDQEAIPTLRTHKIIKSLQELYHSKDRVQRIKQMITIAQHNINQYQRFCRTWSGEIK